MHYADICTGISAATVAWKPLGWRSAFYAEIDKFPSAILRHHYPDTPNLGDITRFKEWPDAGHFDVLMGGTPCQGFSIAGFRKGMDDDRSNLALCFGCIAQHYQPRWIVWENVPGVRSSRQGRDMGAFLRGLDELGYGLAWRSLDAQYAGLAQRRERLFVVGYLGDWRPAAAVLFEPEGLRWDSAPRREAGQRVAGTVAGGARSGGGYSHDDISLTSDIAQPLLGKSNSSHRADAESYVAVSSTGERAHCLNAGSMGRIDYETETLIAFNGRMDPVPGELFGALDTDAFSQCVAQGWAVRRLTPEECEALQGFPRGYTDIPWRGKPNAPDGPRYKVLGNSIAVPCLSWIGQRINLCEDVMQSLKRKEAGNES